MRAGIPNATFLTFVACSAALSGAEEDWANPAWQYRTAVTRPTPFRRDTPRPVEIAADIPLLLRKAGVNDAFAPESVRIFNPEGKDVPCALRTETDVRTGQDIQYVTWFAVPGEDSRQSVNIYFNTRDRQTAAATYSLSDLPTENLLQNADFEQGSESWQGVDTKAVQFAKHDGSRPPRSRRFGRSGSQMSGRQREMISASPA